MITIACEVSLTNCVQRSARNPQRNDLVQNCCPSNQPKMQQRTSLRTRLKQVPLQWHYLSSAARRQLSCIDQFPYANVNNHARTEENRYIPLLSDTCWLSSSCYVSQSMYWFAPPTFASCTCLLRAHRDHTAGKSEISNKRKCNVADY